MAAVVAASTYRERQYSMMIVIGVARSGSTPGASRNATAGDGGSESETGLCQSIMSVPAVHPVGRTAMWNGALTLFCDTGQRRSGAWAVTPTNFDRQSLRGLIEVEIRLDQGPKLVLAGSGAGSQSLCTRKDRPQRVCPPSI